MRIGFFTDGFLPQANGVAASVFETAKELEKRGHEVVIIAPNYPGYIDKSLNVIRLTSLKINKVPEIRLAINLPDKTLRKIIAMDFDVIHGHSGGTITLLGTEIARSKKIPSLLTYHTLWNRYTHYFMQGKVVKPKMMENISKIVGNRVDYIIAPTKRVEKELRQYGVKKPIKVVPSGINIEKFANGKSGYLRSLLKIENDPILLYVGRLAKEKSVDFIIKAFKRVIENESKAHLVLVGDGPDRKELEALAKRLGVAASTHFLGELELESMHEVYKDATVFVFSSTSETQGMVVPEALASGVPVVAIDDPAYECIENGKNGYLVPDIAEFALKCLSIIENKELRHEMSKNAVITSQKLSVSTTVDSLEPVYFELLDRYNKESVALIMGQNQRSEETFVAHLAFWAAILSSRVSILLFASGSIYPKVTLGGQEFYHSTIGAVLMLIGLVSFLKTRKSGPIPLLLLGFGAGLISDEIWPILFSHATLADYWNPVSLIPILAGGILPIFFAKVEAKDRPKFYITTRQLKHTNPENPKVTVVIPAYNEGEFITPTLKSLLNQTYKNFELIVVDNNSVDNTAEVAETYGARVVRETKAGVAAARQAGFFAAKGEIIVSTDADSIVPADWLARIVKVYDDDPKLAGFGGLNELYSGAVTARAAGRYLFPLFWIMDKVLSGGWNMAGFNMTVRKTAFLKIGGFDASLKMGEDIDLSQKLRTVGNLKIDPTLLVFSSGRRYKDGLWSGLMAYIPWWVSKVILRREKPFEFQAVRSEKVKNSKLSVYMPLITLVSVTVVIFYIANLDNFGKLKLF
ncbi:MAG: hypothetical protein A2776_02565 [Candidatus Levybacteria bacterium RIFCSPHIGHO2_01_FULL_40_10]|nr:MAG: hypothetical protein A2776_02565 [Candidatus Levybacteria bacterium RIFCSPHIGHO2_01_FULL_40_10]